VMDGTGTSQSHPTSMTYDSQESAAIEQDDKNGQRRLGRYCVKRAPPTPASEGAMGPPPLWALRRQPEGSEGIVSTTGKYYSEQNGNKSRRSLTSK